MRLRWRLRTMMVAVAVTAVALGWIAFLCDLPGPERGPPLSNDATTALMVLIGAGALGMAYREIRRIAGRAP